MTSPAVLPLSPQRHTTLMLTNLRSHFVVWPGERGCGCCWCERRWWGCGLRREWSWRGARKRSRGKPLPPSEDQSLRLMLGLFRQSLSAVYPMPPYVHNSGHSIYSPPQQQVQVNTMSILYIFCIPLLAILHSVGVNIGSSLQAQLRHNHKKLRLKNG